MMRLASVPLRPVLADVTRAVAWAVPFAAGVWAVDLRAGGAWTLAATLAGGLATLALAARQSRTAAP